MRVLEFQKGVEDDGNGKWKSILIRVYNADAREMHLQCIKNHLYKMSSFTTKISTSFLHKKFC